MCVKHSENEINKHNKGLCKNAYCRRPHQIHGWQCYECTRKKYIASHQLEYSYGILRRNARRRHKEFTLTFEQFKKFAIKNDYLRKKGITAKSFQIDRKDETKGYHNWNIQCITLRENVHKSNKHRAKLKQEAGF
jgi:hypothetical protein